MAVRVRVGVMEAVAHTRPSLHVDCRRHMADGSYAWWRR